jgi:hypothetical protein
LNEAEVPRCEEPVWPRGPDPSQWWRPSAAGDRGIRPPHSAGVTNPWEGQMATTTDSQPQVRMIALEQIRHDANVRELAGEDVDALAGSIALLGQITPAIVRPDGDGYVLVAGHKRYAALAKLGYAEIRAEVRSGESEHAERAAENVVRTQLNPYEPGTMALDATLGRRVIAIAAG